ncbi:branched-chain amino acid transporter AzlD [Erysipelotrichaceae bacterium MTC7]|nr:branched-chain amino acid transporter AzlD [Erysipelotrichaceae bacterium MTC7]
MNNHALIVILVCSLLTIVARLLPFIFFPEGKSIPGIVVYFGEYLPLAMIAMLTVYCYQSVDIHTGTHGIPELLATGLVIALHLWRKNMFISIIGGTVFYMVLVQMLFVA